MAVRDGELTDRPIHSPETARTATDPCQYAGQVCFQKGSFVQRFSVWVSTGLLTAGVSAGVLTGAGVAAAETGSAPSSEAGTSGTSEPGAAKTESPTDPKTTESGGTTEKPTTAETTGTTTGTSAPSQPEPPKKKKKKAAASSTAQSAVEHKASTSTAATETAATTKPATATSQPAKTVTIPTTPSVANATTALRLAQEPVTAATAPTAVNPVKVIARAVTGLVNNIGSAIINAVQALEQFVTGPPVLPAGSTVTVRTSTILLANGQRVKANWYYPDGDQPPEQMILLQHGFLALGPMYSFTAANLAERTNSVVVTPSLPSNFLAGDDHWLGGTGMSEEIANLFTGNRDALTQSAIDAGYATRYGTAVLPEKFALAGHSLGGSLVSGAAGFLATNGAADNLVGVILLDAVPSEGTLEAALLKLNTYADSPGGHYIPVREIGAPKNAWNSTSTVNQALSTARPDRFNGVILSGGVHMDSMQGGNPVIQFFAFLFAGFPQAQNPPAVQNLAVRWLNAWFDPTNYTDDSDALVHGSIIDIDTPKGPAHGRVIGTASAPVSTATRPVVSTAV